MNLVDYQRAQGVYRFWYLGRSAGLCPGRRRNTSVKMAGQWMAIKASGFCLSDIRPDHAYVVLNYPVLRGFIAIIWPRILKNVEAWPAVAVAKAIRQVDGLDSLRPSVAAFAAGWLCGTYAQRMPIWPRADQAQAMMDKALADAGYGYVLGAGVDLARG